MQTLGYIEVDQAETFGGEPSRGSGLWEDLVGVCTTSKPTGNSAERCPSPGESLPRWERQAGGLSATLVHNPVLYADLPRLRRELDAELRDMVAQINSHK